MNAPTHYPDVFGILLWAGGVLLAVLYGAVRLVAAVKRRSASSRDKQV